MGVFTDEQKIARTYSHPSVADTYDIVEQYRAAIQYGPDASSTAVARDLEIPRGRVRPWLDGSKPDSVHAVETAKKLGWLSDEWNSTTRALSLLCGGIFVCGSIRQQGWVPSWTPDTEIAWNQIETALETVGVGHRLEENGRTPELWSSVHGSVLGRVLVTADAPVGNKTSENVRNLPKWLSSAPPSVRADFAELVVRERGIRFDDKATQRIQGSRAPSYFQDIAELIKDVTNESVTYSDKGVTISASAVRALGLA